MTAGIGFTGVLGDLLCGVLALLQVCKLETISVPIRLLADHPVVDPTDATYNWFFRNNWHQGPTTRWRLTSRPAAARLRRELSDGEFPQPERRVSAA